MKMGTSPSGSIYQAIPPDARTGHAESKKDVGQARLLLEAFQTFTQASSSLESAFQELQARTRRLSEELAVRNRQLKKSLREKKEVQNHLARILESLPCGVLVLDGEGNVTLCNPVAARILGQHRNSRLKSGRLQRGNHAVKKYLAAFAARDSESGEVEIPLATCDGTRVLAASSTPLMSARGTQAGRLHILRDITEMKALEARNKRRDRLAAMGEMAVELAHEIRNPLGSIELFASLLEKELPQGSDTGRWAENIRVGSRSLNNIVSNMLHFANPLAAQFQEVNLHDLIQEMIAFAEPILQQREVRVTMRLQAPNCMISGDRELLKQMMLNLLLNSLQAMPARGSLTVGTSSADSVTDAAVCAGVEITVRDTGLGIAPENLARIFDPFFTTNKSGTGLGLSVVHQIVEQHSGYIQVASELNVGTTFTIVLPETDPVSCAAQ